MTIEEQIIELNNEVKAKLAPSPIQGIGVFAIRDIKKGERAYCRPNGFKKWYSIPYERLSELRPEIKEVILERWPAIINKSQLQSPNDDAWLLLFMNHSDNANYDPKKDIALMDIKTGEEILENYKTMPNAKEVYKFL